MNEELENYVRDELFALFPRLGLEDKCDILDDLLTHHRPSTMEEADNIVSYYDDHTYLFSEEELRSIDKDNEFSNMDGYVDWLIERNNCLLWKSDNEDGLYVWVD